MAGPARHLPAWAMPLGLSGALALLACGMPALEPVFHAAFPAQERAMYRQEPFWQLLLAHLSLVGISSGAALLVALLAGVWVTRPGGRAYRPLVESLVAMGQTFPPVAVLAIAVPLIGFGEQPAYIALALYGLLPMLQGVITGLESTPPAAIDAAKGLGMRPWQQFRAVEGPLAAPLVLAGLRTSVTINIGTAAIAATVGAQNLGSPIIIGLSGFNTPYILQGALLTGWLALTVDSWFAYAATRLQHQKQRPLGTRYSPATRRTCMNWFTALSTLFRPQPRTAEQRARDLLRAVDAGGLPLNVAVVNHIARELGLDVSRKARMPETIERIRRVMAAR